MSFANTQQRVARWYTLAVYVVPAAVASFKIFFFFFFVVLIFLNWPQTLSGIYPFFRPADLRNWSNRYNLRYFYKRANVPCPVQMTWHWWLYSLAEIIYLWTAVDIRRTVRLCNRSWNKLMLLHVPSNVSRMSHNIIIFRFIVIYINIECAHIIWRRKFRETSVLAPGATTPTKIKLRQDDETKDLFPQNLILIFFFARPLVLCSNPLCTAVLFTT